MSNLRENERQKNFARLKELTKSLTDLEQMKLTKIDRGWSLYRTVDGAMSALSILDMSDVSVAYFHDIKEETTVERHQHEEIEHLIMVEGQMEIYFDNRDCLLIPQGEAVYIAPKTPHIVRFPNKARVIGITIPASPDYPKFPSKEGH